MSKGRKPGRPRRLIGFGADELSRTERKMIYYLAKAHYYRIKMYQYEAYYLAFNAEGSSKRTAIVEASKIMRKPGAKHYYDYWLLSFRCSEYMHACNYAQLWTEQEARANGYASKKEAIKMLNGARELYMKAFYYPEIKGRY